MTTLTVKYLEALKQVKGWVTVSEWAAKVGEIYPDVLAKAEKDAIGQKNKTTGHLELTARISTAIHRGAYSEKIEIDTSERPKRVRYVSEDESKSFAERELEEDLEPLTRLQRIRVDEEGLSTKEKYRIAEFETIISQLRSFFNLDFEFEHAKAILNKEDPGHHHPDNIQLLLKSHNRMKSSSNWDRFSLDEQIEYIKAAVHLQKMISDKMKIEMEDDVIEQIIERLKSIY